MSDEKRYTERDLILAQRAAFEHGAWAWGADAASALYHAKRHYPLPTITRPRVVVDDNIYCWRVVDGMVQMRWDIGNREWDTVAPATLLSDLLANPTEEVEE